VAPLAIARGARSDLMGMSKRLSAEVIAHAFLSSRTLDEAARKLKVSRASLCRYLKRERVQVAIREIQSQVRQHLQNELQQLAQDALVQLRMLLTHEDVRVRLQAIGIVLRAVKDVSLPSSEESSSVIIRP